jgi:2-dehydro-3-deoxygalactonokinase
MEFAMDRLLIGLDWGISFLRAYLLDGRGSIVDTVFKQAGILQVGDRSFEDVLEASVGHWLDRNPAVPILACGMIGSRQGWLEAPYLDCPAGLKELAENLCPLDRRQGRRIWFVPGITRRAADNTPDVMRGEETQIFGALQDNQKRCHFILPGTHSKWVMVENGQIVRFTTFMTGELFAVLCRHSILGRLMEDAGDDESAFQKGLEASLRAFDNGRGLMSQLFSVRSLGLFNDVPASGLRSYLSGLLIGTEIAEATHQIRDKRLFRLIGDSNLSRLYARALDASGRSSTIEPDNPTASGLIMIAQKANLL